MALYTFGGTPADVLTTAAGDVVPDYPVLVRVAGTGQLVTALYEVDGTTPIGELRTNPAGSPQPGAIRPFKTGVSAIEFEYNDAAGEPVRWYEAGREVAQEALAAALGSLSKADGGTVAGPLTAAAGLGVVGGLDVAGGASVDELAVEGDMSVGGTFIPSSLSLAGMRIYNPRVLGALGNGVADDAPAVQAALDAAYAAGGGWVIVPSGTYRLATLPLRIRRNTRLTLMPGATFVRAVAGTMLLNGDADQTYGGYTGHGNITVEGGVWDMRGTVVTPSNMCISIGHARGVTIRNVEVRDLPGYHGVELNSTKNAIVEGCRFLGYVDPGGRDFSEAVQIDLAKSSGAFGGFGPYDNTVCEDIDVRGCYVGASGTAGTTVWPRGVGSHSATVDTAHRRIRIVGNTFEGCLQYGVVAYAYDDSVIAENTMRNCGSGIRARTIISSDAADSTNLAGVQTNASQVLRNLVIADNTIRGCTGYDDAILLYGETTGRVLGVSITGNTIEGATANENGVRIYYAEQYTVEGNVIRDVTGTGISQEQVIGGVVAGNRITAPGASGISCDTGTGITLATNSVRDAGINGIHLLGGSDIQVLGNYVKGASRSAAGNYGVRASTSVAGLLLAGNRVRKYGSGNEAAWGVSITSTCTGVRRYGNDLADSGTSGALDDQTTAPVTSPYDSVTALSGRPSLAAAANTAAETVVASWTIPAGDAAPGTGYRFVAHGVASTTGTPTLTIRVRLGGAAGVVIASFTAVTTSSAISNRGWRVDGSLHSITSGGSATWAGGASLSHHFASTTGSAQYELTDAAVTKDSTTDQTLVVTAQWSAASASNTATATAGQLTRAA
ncbi:right-handed parallel beta-helix repeat-containing protein [Streptomyces decoyicus]